MTPKQAIDHFGYARAVAVAATRTPGAVSQWRLAGKIPPLAQLNIEAATNGVLVADPDVPRGHKRGRK